MRDELPYQLLADVVLILHFAIVAFVVGGLVLIIVGNLRGWRWVNGLDFGFCTSLLSVSSPPRPG